MTHPKKTRYKCKACGNTVRTRKKPLGHYLEHKDCKQLSNRQLIPLRSNT